MQYAFSAGIWIKDLGWCHAFTTNTKPGFKDLASIVESCEKWNVPFSVFVKTPEGTMALETLVDVPSNAREDSYQRACVEADDGRRYDLVAWLEATVPKAG